jgi:hypothetical protein
MTDIVTPNLPYSLPYSSPRPRIVRYHGITPMETRELSEWIHHGSSNVAQRPGATPNPTRGTIKLDKTTPLSYTTLLSLLHQYKRR